MTTNEIKYVVTVNGEPKEVTFSNRDIEMGSGKIFENNAMVAETLEADTIDVVINMAPARTRAYRLLDVNGVRLLDSLGAQLLSLDAMRDVDPSAFLYGEVVRYYRDGVLDGKFYARQARQVGKYSYHVEGISAVGLLIRQTHNGGMYHMARVGDIIAEIMGAIPYTIDSNVADLLISGWLPAQSSRDNLQQVLFACGASIAKDNNKDLRFMFLGSSQALSIPNRRIYEGGKVNYRNQVTSVDVTEHAFYALSSDSETVLFDNTDGSGTADHFKVIFDEPAHNLTATGLTIHESNCNYAIVSGLGTLTGKTYTHTERVISRATGQSAEENIMTVSDCYMVTALNSANVAERVANYYGRIHETSMGVVLSTDAVKPTAKIQFANPFGVVSVGYIRSAEKVMSGVVRADLEIVTDWEPGPFGSNFNHWQLITASGSWSVPAGVTKIRASLIGGGKGGWSGENGAAGAEGRIITNDGPPWPAESTGNNGAAGKGGEGAEGGKVYTVDLNVTPGQSFSISIGGGGNGGAQHTSDPESTEGSAGGNTTFGSYSSASGATTAFGLVNLFTGDAYGLPGVSGVDGAGEAETSLTYKGVTYTMRGYGSTAADDGYAGKGGHAGNPAAGDNGEAGKDGIPSINWVSGGTGGHGGDAIAPVAKTQIGFGGDGGNGGGGGGGGGDAYEYNSTHYDPHYRGVRTGSGGRGGYGSAGGKGGPGGVLIYW